MTENEKGTILQLQLFKFAEQNYTVTEGNVVTITLSASSTSEYMFNVTVTLQDMNGSATGESISVSSQKYHLTSLIPDDSNAQSKSDYSLVKSQYCAYVAAYILTVCSLHLAQLAATIYEAGPYTVIFSAGLMYATLMVPITDDNTTELSEYFMVVINSTDPLSVVIGSPSIVFITIEEPAGM